jgi:hypothetical protein
MSIYNIILNVVKIFLLSRFFLTHKTVTPILCLRKRKFLSIKFYN